MNNYSERRSYNSAGRVMMNVIAVLAFLIIFGLFATRLTFAGTVNLEPGKSYDVSKYGNNTELKISKDGSYTLSGKSSTVYVSVSAKNVKIYLNNVTLTPGINSNTGKAAAAIDVAEKSGSTVSIISVGGSNNTITGYMDPAINKPGTKTKLILDTDNPSNPGYIYAFIDNWECPTIGKKGNEAPMYGEGVCGNIYIKGGEIKAENHSRGAAIGGGYRQALEGFYMSGGKLTAIAHKDGAGIGSGGLAHFDDINISGGTILAYGSNSSAGIGSGGSGDSQGNSGGTITITGGDIYAEGGRFGAGIGGGGWCGVKNITISGGNIEALGGTDAPGIGSGAGASWTRDTSINIRGGNIIAVGNHDGAGIGAKSSYNRNLSINISGGTIVAMGGSKGDGIGGGGHIYTGLFEGSRGDVKIAISGGTITSYAGNNRAAIGPGDVSNKKFSITLTGGNINCTSEYSKYNKFHGATPKDAEGNTVKLNELKFLGALEGEKVSEISANYGLKDVKTLNNLVVTQDSTNLIYSVLYAYLPESSSVEKVSLVRNGKTVQYDSKLFDDYYTYNETIILDKNGKEGKDGSCKIKYGAKNLTNVTQASATGYVAKSYLSVPDNIYKAVLFFEDGQFKPISSCIIGGVVYSESGVWLHNGAELKLYAEWEPVQYTVQFDSNTPDGCTASGSMSDITNKKYDETFNLSANEFAVKGYNFNGWNTKADGSGTSYSNEAQVKNLGTKQGEVVKLYAQWTAKPYTITLESDNAGQLSSYEQNMTYNVSAQLKLYKNTGFIVPDSKMFVGWDKKGAVDSRPYPDGATVKNLCGFIAGNDDPQGFTLTARYSDKVDIKVYASYSGEPITDFTLAIVGTGDLAAIKKDLTAEEDINHNRTGYYSCTNTGTSGDIPKGTYNLCIRDGSTYKDTGIDVVADDNPDLYSLNYYKVDLSRETPAHFTDASIAHYTLKSGTPDGAKYTKNSVEYLLKGTEVSITAGELKQGYHLENWISTKIDPSGTGWRTAVSFDSIVNGDMDLKATSSLNHYSVNEYDSNVPTGCSSTLEGLEPEGISGIGYGEEYALPECTWKLKGYKFTGWTSIEMLAGGQEGKKTENLQPGTHSDVLALQNDSAVKLIANWEPIHYTLDFNSALPLSEPFLAAEGRACTYDQTLEVPTLEEISWGITDYHFLGWNSQSDGSGDWYEEGAELNNLKSEDGDYSVMWAVWKHDSYMVHFDANGGSGTMESQEIWTNTDDYLDLCRYEKDGYVFSSWNTRANGSGTSYADGAVVNNLYTKKNTASLSSAGGESITLYAQWEKEKSDDGNKKKSGTDTGDHNNEYNYVGLYVTIGILSLLLAAILLKKRYLEK